MNDEKRMIPVRIQILGWAISLFAFGLGFYHTADGLKSMRPLGTEWGAYVVAGLISMFLLLAYSRAVAGVKIALVFYLVCASFNFIFNLNSFYPRMLGKTLLQEESKSINDSITIHSQMLHNAAQDGGLSIKNLNEIQKKSDEVFYEIEKSKGFGPEAKKDLNEFNQMIVSLGGTAINAGSHQLGKSEAERANIAAVFRNLMNQSIKSLMLGNKKAEVANSLIKNDSIMQELAIRKTQIIKAINANDKRVDEDTAVFHKQVNQLKDLVQTHDDICNEINTLKFKSKENGKEKTLYLTPINPDTKAELQFPKSIYLGRFNHTLDSVSARINKKDTWGIIILVLFIDFIVPLGIFLLIRKRENDNSSDSSEPNGWGKIFGKKKPTTF
jgi:hypothetical protein